MHNATLDRSSRLQRVLKVLLGGKRYTTRDLMRKARVCAVNSCVAEIRENGIGVCCEREGGKWYYWLPRSR